MSAQGGADIERERDPDRLFAEVQRLAENHDQVVRWLREAEAEVELLQKANLGHEIRADEVKLGDYLAGLGRVQSKTSGGGSNRVTLFSEGQDWRVSVHRLHRVVVIRDV